MSHSVDDVCEAFNQTYNTEQAIVCSPSDVIRRPGLLPQLPPQPLPQLRAVTTTVAAPGILY